MAKKITDIGAKETDEVLETLEERIAKEYAQAEAEIQEKLDTYLQKFEIKDSLKQKAVENGQITQEDYEKWRVAQIATGENWAEMRDSIAEDLTNTAELAALTTNETMPEVYAINHNYGTYQVEKISGVDTSYTLYNKEAVANLFDDDFDFYPAAGKKTMAKINAGEQLAWDKKNIQSVMIQSLLQGESIGNIATRLAKATGESDRKVAIRNARTLTTSVQNAGRLDSYQRAKDMGINVRKQWIATLDNRTRHEHRILDGQVQELGDPFTVAGYELSYPADPNASLSQKLRMQKAGNVIQGPAFLIYNCRCTIMGVIEGHEIDVTDLSLRNTSKMDEDSYEEWKESHNIQSESITKQDEIAETMQKAYIDEYKSYANGGKWYSTDDDDNKGSILSKVKDNADEYETTGFRYNNTVVEGDPQALYTFDRRSDEFDFEIEDAINYQGYDGLPKIVDADTFDEAVKESNFIAQRTYSASSQDVLDTYREQLYNDKFYVDCSTGGAQYGQGMYCAADYTGTLTDGIKEEMAHYQDLGTTRARKDIIETTKKNLTYDNIQSNTYGKNVDEEVFDVWKKINDSGTTVYNAGLTDEEIDIWKQATAKWGTDEWDDSKYQGQWTDLTNAVSKITDEAVDNFSGFSYTETITLDPSAKIVTFSDLLDIREELEDNGYDLPDDNGVLATLLGYDAINSEGHGKSGSYTVVLNRTKLIIKRETT